MADTVEGLVKRLLEPVDWAHFVSDDHASDYQAERHEAASALEALVVERDALKIESSKHAYEADKAREDRDKAERRSEAFWKPQFEAAEARGDRLLTVLERVVAADTRATYSGLATAPTGAEIGPAGEIARSALSDMGKPE
jgi:hypothetical protein